MIPIVEAMRDIIILITGGTGSLGQALVKRLLQTDIHSVRVFSRHEYDHWSMKQQISDNRIRYLIGDIRDKERLKRAMGGVDYVIHTAALKHVDICEYNPSEAITINIEGSRNVAEVAIDCGVKKVLGISSDKAVHPENIYGTTKQVLERIFTHYNVYGDTKLSCVRFGNFSGSRGSFLQKLMNLKDGEPILVTDADMTRFWITLEEAADFTLRALEMMEGGEIYIPKMPEKSVMELIKDLAPKVEIKLIGKRVGEKLRERLWSEEEESIIKDCGDYWTVKR